ncbi:MAG: YopX family protein [Lachnospiraceae bacterium]
MKREILFRGKHIHAVSKNKHLDGTWIYGYLCDENYINSPELEGEFLIDPETICQCTGFTDKNIRKIFEGDIIKWASAIGEVKWYHGNYTGWYVDEIYMGEQQFTNEMWNECEIIGNIFDNPELIEK